jgi:hypothetical protein
MVTKEALIEWIPKHKGGRAKPPLGSGFPAYATEVRFIDGERWPDSEAWSLVIIKNEECSSELTWIADVRFLASAAPHDTLHDGREFELYEGHKLVARGRILEAGGAN